MSMKETVAQEAVRAAPSVGVGTMVVFGIPLSDLVLYATLIYTALQAYFLLRDKWWRQRGKRKK